MANKRARDLFGNPMPVAWYDDPNAATIPLDEFLEQYADDGNLWWRIGCGHHLNLFDAAIEEIARLRIRIMQIQGEASRSISSD